MSWIAFLLFNVIIYSAPVAAEVGQALEFESNIEQRAYRALRAVDADAQVFVRVKLKQTAVKLPGVSVDFFGSAAVEQVHERDIESVDIRIVTSVTPFPERLKTEILSGFEMGSAKVNLEIVEHDAETLRLIKSREVAENSIAQFLHVKGSYFSYSVMVFFVVFALFLGGLGSMVMWTFSFWRGQLNPILTALQSKSESAREDFEEERAVEKKASSEILATADSELILPDLGFLELVADCYWTHKDGYARWIWDKANMHQRQYLLENWSPAATYAQYLRTVPPSPRNEHTHPYYLNPLTLKDCSVEDLTQILDKNQSLWNQLSPLRQSKMVLPISQKVEMLSAKGGKISPALFAKAKSTVRDISAGVDFGDISIEDELAVWNNPEMLPENLRPGLTSLVWVAKLADTEQKELLAQYSASDLANCWIGPEEVLSIVEKNLPEKKRRLLAGYRGTQKATRSNDTFARLSKEAVKRLGALKETQDAGKAA